MPALGKTPDMFPFSQRSNTMSYSHNLKQIGALYTELSENVLTDMHVISEMSVLQPTR